MYEIVIKTEIGAYDKEWDMIDYNKRDVDSVYHKKYARKGNAEKVAKTLEREYQTPTGEYIRQYAIVRKTLMECPEHMAKEAYCNGYHVYVRSEYGIDQIPPTWTYGSHAPARQLFYRGINTIVGWWNNYIGPYYIEIG